MKWFQQPPLVCSNGVANSNFWFHTPSPGCSIDSISEASLWIQRKSLNLLIYWYCDRIPTWLQMNFYKLFFLKWIVWNSLSKFTDTCLKRSLEISIVIVKVHLQPWGNALCYHNTDNWQEYGERLWIPGEEESESEFRNPWSIRIQKTCFQRTGQGIRKREILQKTLHRDPPSWTDRTENITFSRTTYLVSNKAISLTL